MPGTGTRTTTTATCPVRLEPGVVLVADELLRRDRPATRCPAAALLAGELGRHGVATARGPLHLGGGETGADHLTAVAALLPATGDQVGLAVACADADSNGRATGRAALDAWLAVADRSRTVLLAAPRSFCAGVERAIEVVERALDQWDAPVYVRKQIVHNTHVVTRLQVRGAVFVDELDAVPDGATVVFSAHGVSPSVHTEAVRRGLNAIVATCPLVAKVHAEARRFAARGDTVILIGHAGHEEVEGTLGEAPDHTVLVQTVADVEHVTARDPARVSYLTQTTLAVDETADVVAALHARFPALHGPAADDICYATTNRQDALNGHRRRVRPGARGRLGELLQLASTGRTRPPP